MNAESAESAETEESPRLRVAYQGEPGAHSHRACGEVFPSAEPRACPSFDDAFAALATGEADYAMIPIENAIAGRVADIHHLLPESGLYITGEHFSEIRHNLLAARGTRLEDIDVVVSHVHALGQCRETLRSMGVATRASGDTAGAARELAASGERRAGVIASAFAAEIYGLDILRRDIDDRPRNYTRFVILSREPRDAPDDGSPVITSLVFKVRNVPAALYKALGGFATNGVNMNKLESYQLEGSFNATQFYADIEGHPERAEVRRSLEELEFFSARLRILGVYPMSRLRDSLPTPPPS